MDYFVKSGNPEKQRVACVIVGVFERRKPSAAAAVLDQSSKDALSRVLRRGDMDGKRGTSLVLHGLEGIFADRVMLVGLGREKDFDDQAFRTAIATSARALGQTGGKDAHNYLTALPLKGRDTAWKIRQAVIANEAELYSFDELRKEKTPAPRTERLTFDVGSRAELPAAETGLTEGLGIARGMKLAKDLGNRPGNICTPTHFAEQARALAKAYKGLSCKVLEEADMEALGMGALLSVSRGSRQPAKLIALQYKGGKKGEAPIALVGKGLTFDAGGISLKPAQKMEEMKFDMCGGAAVMGAMKAAAEMALPLNLVGVVVSSENLPDGNANKPGDVVTSMAGITIEVVNTDAEGRLILCDALTWTQQEYAPELVIDMATLTGACVVALGEHASGLFANRQPLAKALLAAGDESGDRAWQMPLWEDYQQQLKSPVADMQNIGGPGGGAITAASFLHRFTRKIAWAHLDIAGTAWSSAKLSTGRPVPLLCHYLLDRARG